MRSLITWSEASPNRRLAYLLILVGVVMFCVNLGYEIAWSTHTCGSRQSLVSRISIEAAESENNIDGVTFGYIHNKWETLKAEMQFGDELWKFKVNCGFLCGGGGYVVVRFGFPVDCIWTFRF